MNEKSFEVKLEKMNYLKLMKKVIQHLLLQNNLVIFKKNYLFLFL